MLKIVTSLVLLLSLNAFAVTKVKPLKIGTTGRASEVSTSSDYVTSKGFAFENSDNFLFDVQSSKIYALSNGISAPVCQAPTSSTDGHLAIFDGTSGHLLKSQSATTAGVATNTPQFLTLATSADLANERVLSPSATNFSTIDGGAGSSFVLNTIQDINSTATPTFGRLLLSGSTNQNFINGSGTMDNATGDETGYTFDYTVNKATSGTTTGIKSNFTDTSSPGLHYLFDLQKGGTSQFRVSENGTLDTLGSVNIARTAQTGTVVPSFSITGAAHTSLTASTEYHDVDFALDRTVAWAAGNLATQRFIRIRQPGVSIPGANTLTETATLTIDGAPAWVSGNISNTYGLWVKGASVNSINAANAVGLKVEAPTGGLQNVAAVFTGGSTGINTGAPDTYLDVRVPSLSASQNDVTDIGGTTRYTGMYVGGTSIVSAPGSGTAGALFDFGWAPTSNSGFAVIGLQSLMSLDGSVNMTSNTTGGIFTLTERGSGGTGSNARALVGNYTTASGSTRAVTTGRAFLAASSIQGSGTVTTLPNIDSTITVGASATVSNGHHIRLNNVSNSGTLSNFDGILIESNTATVGSRKTQLRILGASEESRIQGNLVVGADSSPGHRMEVKDGNLAVTNTGTAGEFRIYEASGSGSNYTGFKAQAMAGNPMYTLPAADGTSGQVLSTNGSGTLSWASAGSASQTQWSKYKAGDTARNSTTTLTADPDLDITVSWENSTKYIIEGAIRFDNSGSATPDLDFQWQGPAVAEVNIIYSTTRFGNTNVALVGSHAGFVNGGTGGTTQDMAASAEYVMVFSGGFTTTGTPGSNDLEFQWAQNVSNGTNVSVKGGSWMRVSKVQ